MSISGTNNPFSCNPVVFSAVNSIISLGPITRVGNVFTFGVGFVWKINGTTYRNTIPFEFYIIEAPSGYSRIDNALLTTANTIELQQGLASETIAIRPTFPENNILLTSWNISSDAIGNPREPITGNSSYKGTINLTAPILTDGNGTTGDYYKVVETGNYDFGNGPISLQGTDFIFYNGSNWELLVNNVQLTPETYSSLVNNLTTEDDISDSDKFNYLDTSDGNKPKKTTWLNIKAKLKVAFDFIYQLKLVSGTNIKTINGNSILGSGDLVVSGGGGDSYFTIEMSMAIGNFTQVSYDRIPLRDNTTDPFPMGEYFDPVTSSGDFRCAAKIIPANAELKAVFFRANNLSNDLRLRILAFDAMNGSISNVTTLALKTLPPITGVKVFKYDLSEILNTSIQPEGRLITLAFFTPTGPVSFQSNRVTCLFKKV